MSNHLKFYINGAWVDPAAPRKLDVINPATEEAFTQISIGSEADVNRAVAAARAAFPKFSQTSKAERVALLKRIVAGHCNRALVMYAGRIVESAAVRPLFATPQHPYTVGLLACVPRLDRASKSTFPSIPGAPPDLIAPPPGCPRSNYPCVR